MTTRGLSIKRNETGSEPVTLEELKLHLAIDFNDHDVLLNSLLKSARLQVEKYTALSLVEKEIEARWETITTEELPYGPVFTLTGVYDTEDTVRTDCTMEGQEGDFMTISANSETPVIVKYVAGYEIVPEDLKLAIMKLASDNFRQRTSINPDGVSAKFQNDWKSTAAPYSRKGWLI